MRYGTEKRPQPTRGKLTAEARRLFARVVDEFEIDDTAAAILETACEAWQRMREAQKVLDADGIVVVNRFDEKRPHPAVAIERDARTAFYAGIKMLHLDMEPGHDGPGRPPGT